VSRTLAVTNQKGGVGKTTSVVSLGAAFVEQGFRVLLVDLDAQSCLTFSLGLDPDDVRSGIHEVLTGQVTAEQALVPVPGAPDGRSHLLAGSIDLSAAESALAGRDRREFVLREALADVVAARDVVLLDCSPSLGLLTLNALAAADEVLVPMQCEMLGHRGVGQLLDTVDDVRRLLNPALTVRGVLPTMFDGRVAHSRAVLDDVAGRYELPVLTPPIPRSIRFAEAPAVGRSILTTSRTSRGAQAYRDVAASLARAWGLRPPRRRTSRRVRART
jgi:chromosome partitioning protein